MRPLYTPFIAMMALLVGCAGPSKQYALGSETYNASNAGFILGALSNESALGSAIDFRNLETGESFTYRGARDFSMWLPEGSYALASVSRQGALGPYQNALSFQVKKGAIAYVGTVVIGCASGTAPVTWYGQMNCGLLALGKCKVPYAQVAMCVLDEGSRSIQTFLNAHSEFKSLPIDSALMK